MSSEGPYAKAAVLVAVVAILVSLLLSAAENGWWPFPPPDERHDIGMRDNRVGADFLR